ncbi:hypothetical protein DUNSADRAFT_1734 [Dunaliella salina]|uniref:Secreted protein n=1 Tax=Dunaliella salina TaxID=3046 RepID=A0ABQ7GX02_DUNSA|nr:hypothetical protein DUNSADRAFT_1734 [Dunaliella salina]|eukprot:KAF5839037.1 hypothetical protein DUNSADRAFT_1734 [Dunaliella salina]
MSLLHSLRLTRCSIPALQLAQYAFVSSAPAGAGGWTPPLSGTCSMGSLASVRASGFSDGNSLLGKIPLSEIASLATYRRSLLLQLALDDGDDL